MLILAALLALNSPAGSGAVAPHVATLRGGAVVMSWVEPGAGKAKAMKFATLANGNWSAPRVIVEREDLLASWADVPSIVEDGKGTLFASWLQTTPAGARDVYASASSDGGKTWRMPRLMNRDGKPVEHGFVSLAPRANGGVELIWLDGRDENATQLRFASLDAALNATGETVLDPRVCECCGTGMAMTARGAVLVYRDRSDAEVRDIGVMRIGGKPSIVHADRWTINGCPVNGPQIDARGNDAAVAWFTAPDNKPQVNVAFSKDAGSTWHAPTRIDGGKAAGHVDVVLLADGSALATWVEGDANAATVMARRIWPSGKLDAPMRIASTSNARNTGSPRATLVGKVVVFAWTDPLAKTIRVAQQAF